ncbi:PVC-type heme-binding CxxCH protein [Frigoriglobus tundricola]|uniref:Beta-propeller-type glycoside hydrolase n=1 Tax=Frigoriglobus tundricola TaxID=2774151 RepID=A0A6M5YQ69_9BACT|nr:PVC-type heme-binding CxxCH protein [Frigoriglobus tundricola]QJW96135.1 beta-propeller-type glycoside hydrolase [Frigoriglobus tundricola]
MSRLFVALPLLAFAAVIAFFPNEQQASAQPKQGSDADALAQVKLAEKGMRVDVWAAAPLMMNPVSFCFDEKGRVFVAETTRFEHGVPDTRAHMYWLDEDLANRSIDDLLAMYKKHNFKGFEKYEDQVRVVWDSTGSGRADKSEVFAGGFNRPQDGLAAGVLARKGQVYLTCIPDLYVLKDTKGTNKADEKKSLFTGFGPTVQFLGHDLHGLRMGPDRKLYFSVGDRGFNVTTKEGKKLSYPNTGAVLRCDPDGKNLEVVHSGLRNPQEIAFDDYGNLFTFDNNCDSGDRARWVHIVEGGDSGWRGGFQYGTLYHTPSVPQGNRGAWNTEKLWEPQHDGQPAWIVPPLLNLGNGPAGITHYPGIGLNDKYKDHFFACDFTSDPGSSVIWALSVKPKGASFEVTKPEAFVRGMVPTDCEFGPDGAFYWSDWVGGWAPQNRGRIFRAFDPEAMKNPQVEEAQKLLAEGFEKKSIAELAKLLEFPHQLVRQEAQFELAGRKAEDATKAFVGVLKDSKNQLARLHAVWGLGIVARNQVYLPATKPLLAALKDKDSEVRRVACNEIGSLFGRHSRAWGGPDDIGAQIDNLGDLHVGVRDLLADPNDRVKAAAVIAYAKIGDPTPISVTPRSEQGYVTPFFDMLRANNDKDPYLRHTIVMGLGYWTRGPADLINVWKLAKKQDADKYDAPAVRLGVVLALRKLKSDKAAEFLSDSEPRIVAEAARAIYDERLGDEGMAALAKLAEKPTQPDAIIFRALAANYFLGTAEAAGRVARFAAKPSEADYVRAFALKLLADWPKPPRRDPITGLTLDLPPRDAKIAVGALLKAGTGIFAGTDVVRKEAAQAAAKLNVKEFGPVMAAVVKDAKTPVSTRVEALYAVEALKDPGTKELAAFALASEEPKLRAAGRAVKAHLDPASVLKDLPGLLDDPKVSVAEKQGAFAILAGQKSSEETDRLLDTWLDQLNAGKVAPALVLDVLDAAEKRAGTSKLKLYSPLKPKVEKYRSAQAKLTEGPKGDKLASYFDSLEGGDAVRGRDIFLNNTAVYCQRCHKLDNQGGDVGPALNGIAAEKEKDRRYLLEAVVMPNAKIAKGFETVVLTLADERVVSGIIKSEDKNHVKLVTAEAKELTIPVDDIVSRRTGPSAMPDDLHKKLTHRDLRDLVEFLSGLKEPLKK